MPDQPPKPVDRRAFFRKLMLGALDKAEASSKAVGGKIADAVKSAQAATEKKRLQEEASRKPPHPVANDHPIIRRPDNHVSRGSVANAPDTQETPADPPPSVPPEEPPGGRSTRKLRPPGALVEQAFTQTCSRCALCAQACPASCIMLDGTDNGLPHIIARESACTACETVACSNACPTGALLPLKIITQISIGLAVVHHPTCLRTPSAQHPGQDCRQCIAPCPIGESAIGIDPQGRIQIRPGCIGCGLCEQSCPTDPTSIYINPTLNRPAA